MAGLPAQPPHLLHVGCRPSCLCWSVLQGKAAVSCTKHLKAQLPTRLEVASVARPAHTPPTPTTAAGKVRPSCHSAVLHLCKQWRSACGTSSWRQGACPCLQQWPPSITGLNAPSEILSRQLPACLPLLLRARAGQRPSCCHNSYLQVRRTSESPSWPGASAGSMGSEGLNQTDLARELPAAEAALNTTSMDRAEVRSLCCQTRRWGCQGCGVSCCAAFLCRRHCEQL